MIAHLLSFDIEGFIESSHDSFRVPERYISEASERLGIETNTLAILDTLAAANVEATFFILGRIGRDMPELVRRIASAGHEIAAHGFEHRRLYNLDAQYTARQVRLAKECLEQAAAQRVIGFRAPDFSIVRANLYVLDQLLEAGYQYDSSVYPIGCHDVYGIAEFPRAPFALPNGLVEFPLSTVNACGVSLPFGGGGYLRLYPLWLTMALMRGRIREGVSAVVYMHPFEMGQRVPYIAELPLLRRWRTYVGLKSARYKLERLLKEFRFVTFSELLPDLAGEALSPELQHG